MRTKLLMAFGITGVLAGCATTPAVPYWDNPKWINELVVKISNNLVYPDAVATAGFLSGQAIVQFTYDNGRLKDVHIVKSTGNQILDSAITTQITDIKPPLAVGLNTSISRQFQLPVKLNIAHSRFYRSVRDAIVLGHTYYPRSAVLHSQQGLVEVRFEYRNGHVLSPTVVQTIGLKIFEEAAIKKVASAKMPPPPAWALDKTFTFKVPICFTFSGYLCPGPNIEIRYLGSNTPPAATTSSCTKVGFAYKENKISDAHVVSSSGDANLDKAALATISQGNFPQPSADLKKRTSSFEIPVCFSNKAQSQSAAKMLL